MKKHFLVLCGLMVAACFWLLVAQQDEFIVQRKKEPAVSAEKCAEGLGCIVNVLPELIRECAHIQALFADVLNESLTHLNGYIGGDKESFLQRASKGQRSEFNKNSVLIKKELEDVAGQLVRIKQMLQKHSSMLKSS